MALFGKRKRKTQELYESLDNLGVGLWQLPTGWEIVQVLPRRGH